MRVHGRPPNRDVRLIYQSLPKSEVIVTYSFGSIYDYMNDNARFLAAMAPLELSTEHLRSLLKERRRHAGRYFAGRLLGQMLKTNIGSRFTSRFFLHSNAANRDMWFVHYSKVPRSRLVMSEAHWAVKNSSITQGAAGLDMLGFSPDWEDQIGFGFEYTDEGRIHTALMADLPRLLDEFDASSAPTFDVLLTLSADNTAATESQFKSALRELETEGEVEVLTPGGTQKRAAAQLRPSIGFCCRDKASSSKGAVLPLPWALPLARALSPTATEPARGLVPEIGRAGAEVGVDVWGHTKLTEKVQDVHFLSKQ